MATNICTLICAATVISWIVEFAKPAYEKIVSKKYEWSISIWLSFILWIVASFSLVWYLTIELNIWATILLWLALGTWATLFYDVWRIVQEFTSKSE